MLPPREQLTSQDDGIRPSPLCSVLARRRRRLLRELRLRPRDARRRCPDRHDRLPPARRHAPQRADRAARPPAPDGLPARGRARRSTRARHDRHRHGSAPRSREHARPRVDRARRRGRAPPRSAAQGAAEPPRRDRDPLDARFAARRRGVPRGPPLHPVRAGHVVEGRLRGRSSLGRPRGEPEPVGDARHPRADPRPRPARDILPRVRDELRRHRHPADGARDDGREAVARARHRAVIRRVPRARPRGRRQHLDRDDARPAARDLSESSSAASSSSFSSRSASARPRCCTISGSIRS